MKFKAWLFSVYIFFAAYYSSAQQVQTIVQTGHYSAVTAVCYSPDGRFIATGSEDKTVKLWRRADGREIRSYNGNSSGIRSVSINSSMSLILAVGDNGIVTIWNLNTGEIVKHFKHDTDKFTCAGFNPQGTRIATGSYKSFISVWEISTGEKILDLKATPAEHEYARGFDYPEAGSVFWSSDGKYIVAGVADYTAIIWDAVSGKELHKYKNAGSTCTSCVCEAIITSDNKYVINTSDDSLNVFDMESGKLVRAFAGQGGSPEGLTVSNDGKSVGAIEYGVAEIWNLATGKLLSKSGDYSDRKVISLALSPDGKEFTAGNEKRTADLIVTATGKTTMVLKGYLNQVNERILNDPYMYWAGMVNEAKLSPDGKLIAVGRTGNNAKLIDFKTGKVFRTLRGHNSMVISLCF
ncbi:MAG: hypothetical protein HZB98_01540, partial [Bacteroidia bacterium]|nr:hypothetical protein [Bacteroidia bacterium]